MSDKGTISSTPDLEDRSANSGLKQPEFDKYLPNPGIENLNPSDIGFWSLLAEDFCVHECAWFSPGFWTLAIHRFGNWRLSIQPRILRAPLTIFYRIARAIVLTLTGIKLDYIVRVGRRVKIEHFGGMILGAKSIGNDVTIRQNTTFGVKSSSPPHLKPIIENGCSIGAGAVIVGGITVGEDSVIGANVVLSRSVPPRSMVTLPRPQIRLRSLDGGQTSDS